MGPTVNVHMRHCDSQDGRRHRMLRRHPLKSGYTAVRPRAYFQIPVEEIEHHLVHLARGGSADARGPFADTA